MSRNDFFKYILLNGGSQTDKTELETEVLPYAFNSNGHRLRNYRIYGNTINGDSVGDLVTEGEHAGKYCVPVTVQGENDESKTVNIELDNPLRKVGDDVDYIDFREQKQHRVRKNLLQNTATNRTISGVTFTVNSDGSITCNGTASNIVFYVISSEAFSLPVGRYKLNGAPTGGEQNYNFKLDVRVSTNKYYPDTGNGGQFSILRDEPITLSRIVIYSGYTCDNLTFYPMIRKADIEDDTYEPYIENTELDVALPGIPALAGTNTLSVGTTVQPSKIWIQGNISEIETVSTETQALQTNMQSLQPLSLDENAELEPSDKNEFQTNDISEMPVEDENSIEEILETENLETTRDGENAE